MRVIYIFCLFHRTLGHENVVRLHGIGVKGPRSFMVHENLQNGTPFKKTYLALMKLLNTLYIENRV